MPRTTLYVVCEYNWQYNDEYYYQVDGKPYEVRIAYLKESEAEKERDKRHQDDLIEQLEAGELKDWDKDGLKALTSMSDARFLSELEELNLEYDEDQDDVIWPENHELTGNQKAGLVRIFDRIAFYKVEETVLVH